jgi:1,4-dihydroxy-2-naphthoate octaprenyltransferase
MAKNLRLFIQLSRPFFLLAGMLFYALGVGIARYLGHNIDWSLYLIGQVWVSALQLSTHYLNEYFDIEGDGANRNRTLFSGGSGVLGEGEGQLSANIALLAAATALTTVALSSYGLVRSAALNPSTSILMVIAFLGAFFYSVPPIRLASSGFGEIVASILLANLVPAFAFVLQGNEIHRLIAMSTFPLTALAMAAMLAFELPDYFSDLKFEKRTLMVRLGWQQGIWVHHLFIASAYLLLAIAFVYGLPAALALPPLLTLPLGLLQIWYLRRIEEGIKPNWSALTLNAVAIVSAYAYLITYAFWTR